jgi:uncharacterized protein (TIGR02246 family)
VSRDAIADLLHTYADAVVRRDGDRWASCWAEDARWVLGPGREVVGRDEIVDLWHKAMGGFTAVVQLVHNGTVALDGDRGSGRWYISEHFRRTGGEVGILLAHYDDTYVREGGAWRFASRALVARYQGPPDLSADFRVPD